MRRSVVSIVVVMLATLGAMAGVVLTDTTPQLGLDLQGGLSVVLAPTDASQAEGDLGDRLDKAVDIVRNRVDALGVAEPEIGRQGDTIVVDLPGVEEQGRARDLIGRTAELQFRPVINAVPVDAGGDPTLVPPQGGVPTTEEGGGAGGGADTETNGRVAPRVRGQADETTTTTTTEGAGEPTTTTVPPEQVEAGQEFDADEPITAVGREGELIYQLAPAQVTGDAVSDAQARFQTGEWVVNVDFTGEGSQQFDAMAAQTVGQQVAIVLDGVVQSAPVIQQANFGGTAQISGTFSEGEAKDLALVLRFGALPVELEQISAQEVSASLGRDQLAAGIFAGAIGLGIVAIYMILYYRILGFVVWLSLAVTGAAVYAIVSWLGGAISLTLTLAGVVGLIVAIGVAVDSNIVYFERLKEELRTGRTVRSATDRSFKKAFRTIVTADVVTLLGAGLLWLIAIGSVRGFAFYLGLVTALDLVVSYFFMHHLVVVIGRNRWLTESRWLGVRQLAGATETKR